MSDSCENNKERIAIDTCNLSIRTANLLSWAKIDFIDELEEKTPQELMSFRGCGMKTLREIRKELAKYGKCLKGDFIANTEAEKKVIENLPTVISEIKQQVIGLERAVSNLYSTLEILHLNLNPDNNR